MFGTFAYVPIIYVVSVRPSFPVLFFPTLLAIFFFGGGAGGGGGMYRAFLILNFFLFYIFLYKFTIYTFYFCSFVAMLENFISHA